ncbi:hypothetical protein EF405_03195 [Cyclobacteriaceae bacterium YHN15]|jgi:hypothetical protein|nr:hypothetical protein EF405_03195 [Cyclobacteriaceae bacterium YHN15]
MWIASKSGFVSVVQHFEKQDMLLVRARVRKDLQSLFDNKRIIELDYADYRFRVEVSKQEFAEIMVNQIKDIDYPNFKNHIAAKGEQVDKLGAYHDIWRIMWHYGKEKQCTQLSE